jgi:FkbM family methyltransferase
MFEYRNKRFQGVDFYSWELIQFDVEANLPGFIGKEADEITNILVVGAWRGDEVQSFLQFPRAELYCFEANPQTFNELRGQYRGNDRVHCYDRACAAENGTAIFYETNVSGNGSMLPVHRHGQASQTDQFVVETIRLDSMAELQGKEIDLLWADVQGFELQVLRGATGLLPRVAALFLEVSVEGQSYKNAAKLSNHEEFVQVFGFSRIAAGLGPNGEGNALFVKSGLTQSMCDSAVRVDARLESLLQTKARLRRLEHSAVVDFLRRIVPQPIRTFIKHRLR